MLKGNAAVLRSMKTQETHVISTLHDMLKWYTTELFDKLKETQDQSAQNTKEQERVQKAYFEQLATMQTDYAGQLNTQIDQLGVDINSRFDNNVVDPLNVLQGHLKTVNDNLISLGKWLADRPIFATDDAGWTPPTSVLDVSSVANVSALVREAYAEAYGHVAAVHGEVLELSQSLHGAMGREVSRDEQRLLPLLSRLASELAGLNATARTSKEEPKGPQTSGLLRLRSAAHTLRRYRQSCPGVLRETLRETFQRRTKKSLQPALRRFRKQALLVATLSSSLVQFGVSPKASKIGEPTSSFWASADKAEKYQAPAERFRKQEVSACEQLAASKSMFSFRWQDLMMLIHRDVSEYVQKARVFVSTHKDRCWKWCCLCGSQERTEMCLPKLQKGLCVLRCLVIVALRKDTLAQLLPVGDCEASVVEIGRQVAEMRLKEQDYGLAVQGTSKSKLQRSRPPQGASKSAPYDSLGPISEAPHPPKIHLDTIGHQIWTPFLCCCLEDHVVSLLRTWRSVSQNLDFLANLVVDGEFLEARIWRGVLWDVSQWRCCSDARSSL